MMLLRHHQTTRAAALGQGWRMVPSSASYRQLTTGLEGLSLMAAPRCFTSSRSTSLRCSSFAPRVVLRLPKQRAASSFGLPRRHLSTEHSPSEQPGRSGLPYGTATALPPCPSCGSGSGRYGMPGWERWRNAAPQDGTQQTPKQADGTTTPHTLG